MGSEMFASMLWLPVDEEPNWEAAFAKIDTLTYEGGREHHEVSYTSFYSEVEYEIQEAKKLDRDHDPDFHLRGLIREGLQRLKEAIEGEDRQLIEWQMYGWRVFVTGTFGDDTTELGTLIGDLNVLELISVAGFNPRQEMVEVISYGNRHGVDVSCHSPAKADAVRAQIARDNWEEIIDSPGVDIPDEPPEDDLEAVSLFVDNLVGGSYLDSVLIAIDR